MTAATAIAATRTDAAVINIARLVKRFGRVEAVRARVTLGPGPLGREYPPPRLGERKPPVFDGAPGQPFNSEPKPPVFDGAPGRPFERRTKPLAIEGVGHPTFQRELKPGTFGGPQRSAGIGAIGS